MADDIMKFLGLSGDAPDKHPDEDILSDLGLKLSVDVPREGIGPPQPGPVKYPAPPQKRMLERVHEAIDPARIIPAWASRTVEAIGESARGSSDVVKQGLTDVTEGRPATGAGRVILGTAGVGLSPLTGTVKSTVEDPLTAITGNPDFGSKAALMFPVNVGGPTVRTAVHNIHPTTRAADEVARIAGPENVPGMLDRLRSNPRLRPIDTNDQLRMSGQGLIASPGSPEASRVLTENMRASAAGARDAVRGTYDDALGAPPNLFEELERMKNKAKSIGQANIAPPLIASKPVDTSSTIADIDKVLNPAPVKMTPGTTITPTPLQQKLVEVRQRLASGDKEVLTDADRLHDIQSDLRREAEDLLASSSGADRTMGHQLMDYRNKLVDNIDASAPGYKKGLKKYKDQKDIERAFDFGRDVLKNTDDVKTDPSFLKNWVNSKDRTPEELAAARLGARQAIEAKMGRIKQSALDPGRSGTDVPQIEFNKQKLEHLFGKEQTEKMFKHLQDERDIALTNNRGLGNSKTAETQAYQKRLEPRDISQPHSQLPFWAAGLGSIAGGLTSSPTVGGLVGTSLLGVRGAKSMYDWLARRNETSRNRSIADIITRNDPETQALLSIAAQRVGQRNKLHNLITPP